MVKLRFETDLANSLKAGADLTAAFERVGKTVTNAAKEMKALEAAAKRVVDQNLSPQEKYNQKLDTMAKAVKAGKMSMEEAEKTAGRLREQLDKTGKSHDGAFGSAAIGSLKSYLTGMLSIGTALAVVRSEIDAAKAASEKTAQAQLTAAGARDILKRNIGVLGKEKARAFEARGEALASELVLPQAIVDKSLAEAFSASGGDVEATFSRVRLAGQFLKTQPEAISAFAGSLGDISKATGDPNNMRNLGFLMTIGAMSRLSDQAQMAKNIPASLASAKTFGANAEQGGALFAALSVAAADFEGDVTKTATITSNEALSKFFNEKVKKHKFKADAVDTFGERLALLWSDPKLAKEFVGNGGEGFGRAQTRGPLIEFYSNPNSEIAKKYRENLAGFGTAAQQAAIGKDTIDYLGEGRIAGTAAIERTIGAVSDQFRITQDADLTEESREAIIGRTYKLRNNLYYVNKLNTFLRQGATMSPEEAIRELEYGVGVARNRAAFDTGNAADINALIDNTEKMISELRGIRDQQQKTNAPKPSGRQE